MDSISRAVEVGKHLKSIIESGFFGKFGRIRQFTGSLPGQLKVFGLFFGFILLAQLLFSVSPLSATEVVYGGPAEQAVPQEENAFEQGAALAESGIFDEIDENLGLNEPLMVGGAAAPATLFSPTTVPENTLKAHTVLPGDTAFSVAEQYGITESQLAKANTLSDGPLIVGDSLIIPQAPVAAASARASAVRTSYLPKGFVWPAAGPIGPAHGQHAGRDIPNKLGTPIVAAGDGTVVQALYGYSGGYGNHVVIDNSVTGYDVLTMYAHMTDFIVVPGQQVKKGEVIGYMGSTGRSTGSHVHFEVREK